MTEQCWLNGELVPLAAARIHPLDRGFLFGDGLFETLRAYSGQVFLAREHLARLRRSAKRFRIDLPFSDPDIIAGLQSLLAANALEEARLRLVLTRGLHTGNLGLPPAASPTLLATTEPLAQNLAELQNSGVKLELASPAVPRSALLARHKTLNRLNYLLAREQAQAQGAFDALLLDEQGQVAETTVANIFLVQGRSLITPPLDAPILPGITRAVVCKLALQQGLTIEERDFPIQTLFEADESFLTSSIAELVPVIEVAGKEIGSGKPGKITRDLLAAVQALARSKDPRV